MFSLKLTSKSNAKTKLPTLPAFGEDTSHLSPQDQCPQLQTFKPKAHQGPLSTGSSTLFTNPAATSSEDTEVIQKLAKEFEEETLNDDEQEMRRKRKAWQDKNGLADEASLYEEGKFKMSKVESRQGGLIKMKSTKEPTKSLKPQYVTKLIQSATLRDAEREIIHEAKLVKDLEKELEETGGAQPKTYVTSGYKRRLQERQQAAEQLAAREKASEPKTTTDFQRVLFTQAYASQADETESRSLESSKPEEGGQ